MNSHKQKIIERIEMLSQLDDDHGGENEKGANSRSFEIAKEFIESQAIATPFLTSLDENGFAVFEFHDHPKYELADMTFLDSGLVSCYRKTHGQESHMFEAHHTDNTVTVFFRGLAG